MATRVTRTTFERTVSAEIGKLFVPLGFRESASGAFTRHCGDVIHGFGLTADLLLTYFHVSVGAYVPSIDVRTDYVAFGGKHYPTLLVSRWLGEFKRTFTHIDYNYYFNDLDELLTLFPRVHSDFVEQAEPWLARLRTVDDVTREFYRRCIGPPTTGDSRPPDPYAWAIYGWLLQECGHAEVAREWLQKAYDFVTQPPEQQAGRLIPRTLPGSRPIPLTAEDNRLIELLEKDLNA